MIQGKFRFNQSDEIVSFELSGHANAGPYGSDLVCAAVSALTITTVNSLETIAQIKPLVESDEEMGGYLYVTLPQELTNEQMLASQILLKNLLLGLEAMTDEYQEFIQIEKV